MYVLKIQNLYKGGRPLLTGCRTASLGSHVDGCSSCGHVHISYSSCRNRHCPKCQGAAREKWIQAGKEELLPIPDGKPS